VVAHLAAWTGRRLGLGAVTAVTASLAVGAMTIVLLRYGAETTAGLPDRAVFDALGTDLGDAWRLFQDEGAPAPVAAGFVASAMAAMVLIAVTADALAFRVGAPVEATIPATGLFLFTTVLSGPDHRITSTLLFVGAVLAFVLADRVARRAATGAWLAAPRGRGTTALLRAGAGLAAIGLIGGVLIGPVLPGAEADPIVDLDAGGGDERVTISPLVEIQTRLVEQSEVEVFTVRSDERAYWRMTALDRFDGAVWSAGGEYVGATGSLPRPAEPSGAGRRRIHQEFEIGALADIWLPAAYEPEIIDAGEVAVEWNAASSSLVVEPGRAAADDVRYEVSSSAPVIDPAAAAASRPAGPELDPLRRLPEDFSAVARAAARDATAAAASPYDEALALQDFFRTGFEYSLDVPPGHGAADIDAFLETRVGYCEQFAGAYAAMARSLGLPARVAVGFTPGEVDPDEPDLFHVRGEHAHAWPEVYLDGLGWVAFEPTPGRGAPGGEVHTGVAEQQAGEEAPGVPAPPTTTITPPTTVPPVGDEAVSPPSDPQAAAREATSGDGVGWRTVAALALVGLAVGWLVVLPALVHLRRIRARRRAAGAPAVEIAAAWAEALDHLSRIGLHRRPAETPLAYDARVQQALAPDGASPMTVLAASVTTLWFGGRDRVDAAMATGSRRATSMIASEARERAGWRRWLLSGLDPRRLAPHRDDR
jgi:transglutaminase-like putative cysteine protease